jgi:lysophospholipase L1-like esterase
MILSSTQRFSRYCAILGYVVLSLLAAAILLELVSWLALSAYGRIRSGTYRDPAASPAYAADFSAREFWNEESVRQNLHKTFTPFSIWSIPQWHSKYINNDETETGVLRRTANPTGKTCATKNSVNVWVFGGSTVYGTGVPDLATLPSYLSRQLNSVGRDCKIVSNFGVEGYVSNQELIVLLEQLKTHRPEIVVFYDGINDAGTGEDLNKPPLPYYDFQTIKDRVEGSIRGRFDFVKSSHAFRLAAMLGRAVRGKSPSTAQVAQRRAKAGAVLDNYEGNLRLARALGAAYGFETYAFWQPSLYYGRKPLVPFEQNELSVSDRSPAIIASYEEAESRAAQCGCFVFLGDVFDSIKEPLYLDVAHLGPRGNELAAQAVAKYIEDQLLASTVSIVRPQASKILPALRRTRSSDGSTYLWMGRKAGESLWRPPRMFLLPSRSRSRCSG